MYPSRMVNRTTALGAVMAACMAISHTANAAFVMTLEDITNGGSVSITDNSNDGLITHNGSVGNFTVNVTTGVSKPLIGPGRLDLNSINVSGGSGTLVITLTDTDFTAAPGFIDYWASYGGTTDGSVSFEFLYDSSNQPGVGDTIASGSFTKSGNDKSFSDDVLGTVLPASPYSLTIIATITHTGAGQLTSFDAELVPGTQVPVPAAIWLFGSAVMGLAAARKHR